MAQSARVSALDPCYAERRAGSSLLSHSLFCVGSVPSMNTDTTRKTDLLGKSQIKCEASIGFER